MASACFPLAGDLSEMELPMNRVRRIWSCVLQGRVWRQVFALSALKLWVFHSSSSWATKLLKLQNQELKLDRLTACVGEYVRIPA